MQTGASTTPRRRAASRRTRRGRMGSEAETQLPAKAPPTEAEKAKLTTMMELVNADGGVKNDAVVLTVVMVMHEERRPRIHERLLDMLMQSCHAILKEFMRTKQFMPALHNWMNLYSKEGSEEWREVLIKIVRVFGKLPLMKDDIRELRIKFKKLLQVVKGGEIKAEVEAVLEGWDEKRKEDEKGETERRREGVSRLNSWNKRKAGKAFVAVDPDVKCRKVKLTRKFSGPLSASHAAASKGSAKGSVTSTPRASPRQQSSKLRSLDLDALPPEVTKVIEEMKMEELLKQHKDTAPSELIHSMESPPSDAVFYAQQMALYQSLKSKSDQGAQKSESDGVMQSETQWSEPATVQLPAKDVEKVLMASTEKKTQVQREQSIAATDSSVLFASLNETHPPENTKGAWTAPIPFFPHNQEEFASQQKVMTDAGVAVPSVLGNAKSEKIQLSPMGPLTSSSSPPISDASNHTDSHKQH